MRAHAAQRDTEGTGPSASGSPRADEALPRAGRGAGAGRGAEAASSPRDRAAGEPARVRRRWAVGLSLAAVLLVALALRAGYLWEISHDILFTYPPLDSDRYVHTARQLAFHGRDEPGIYWQPPGFQLLLAAVFRLLGPCLLVPRILHLLASLGCVALVFLLGRRVFSTWVGLGAAAVLAVHGVFIHGTLELLPTPWIALLDLGALLLLLCARDRASPGLAWGAGLLFGLSAVFRPVILAFVPVGVFWLARAGTRRVALAAFLVIGTVLPIVPVTVRNAVVGREFVLISSNAGLNFYLGNNPRSDETLAIRPGRQWQELTSEPARAGVRGDGAASSYFFRKGLRFVVKTPGQAVAGMARKLYLYFNGWEIPRDGDIYAERPLSRVLRLTVVGRPFPLPNGLLVPLALLGAVLVLQERSRAGLLVGYLAVQAVVTACFFVTSRYRVPATPVLALLAVFGVTRLAERLARTDEGGIRRRVLILAGALVAVVLFNLPTRERSHSYAAELAFYRGVAYRFSVGDMRSAERHFRLATEIDPRDARAFFELGNTLADLGEDDEALEAWARAAQADPSDPRPRRNAAMLRAKRPAGGPASLPDRASPASAP